MEMRYPENSPHTHKVIGDFLDTKYVPFTIGTNPSLYHTNELKQLDKLTPLIFYENQLEADWAVYAYTLQHIFRNKNLKYYMFNTCHDLPVNDDNQEIVDKLDTDLYYKPTDFDNSMLYWALNQGFEKTNCWHLKADGHAAWAEYLDQLMNQQGLFNNLSQPKALDKSDRVRIAGKVITLQDVQTVVDKYRIETRIVLDSMYDKMYLLFSEKETIQSMKIKVNIINKDLIKRFGPSAKIDKFDNQFNEMDDAFITEHFRKQIST
jgi:hypothetical protein